MYDSRFTPPSRRSLTDAQLQDALTLAQADEAGILAAMNLLEEQASLREQEKLEFAAWESDLLIDGSAAAHQAINLERSNRGLAPLEFGNFAVLEASTDLAHEFTEPSEPQMPAEKVEPIMPVATVEPIWPVASVEPIMPVRSVEPIMPVPAEVPAFSQPVEQEVAQPSPIIDESVAIETVSEDVIDPAVLAAPMEVEKQESPIVSPAPIVVKTSVKTRNYRAPRTRASSQFWVWSSIGASPLAIGIALVLGQLNLSFGQGVLAIVLGATASAGVVGVAALAGKRSGLPTMTLSRATFGVFGNSFPAAVQALLRLFLLGGAAGILFVLLSQQTPDTSDLSLELGFQSGSLLLIAMVLPVLALAVFIAIKGGNVLFSVQKYVGVASFVCAAVAIAFTFTKLDLAKLSDQNGGGWLATLGAAVLVFSVFGLVWSGTGADFARKLAVSERGAAVIGWSLLSLAVIPSVIAIAAWAFFISLSDEAKFGFSRNFVFEFANQFGVVVAGALALWVAIWAVVSIAMSMFSTSQALASLKLKIKPAVLHPILALLALALGYLLFSRLGTDAFWYNLEGYLLTLAVPVAGWAGIFCADILIRRIAYHEVSLSRSYGFYKPFNWVNLGGWLVACVIGFGLSSNPQVEFAWQGYLSANPSFWQLTHFGILVTFAIGLLLPVVLGIPRIKKQEAEVLSLEARRNDLKDIFGVTD
jgi:nucleobase:cation symporter-1, NCS1 family